MSPKSPQSDEWLKSYIKRKEEEEEEEEEDDEPFFSMRLLLWRARALERFACCVCKSPVRSRARHDSTFTSPVVALWPDAVRI